MLDLDKYQLDPAQFAQLAHDMVASTSMTIGNGDSSADAAAAYTGDEVKKSDEKKEKDSTAKDVTFKILDTAAKITTEVVKSKADKPRAKKTKKSSKKKKKEGKEDKTLQTMKVHEQEVNTNLKRLAEDAEAIARKVAASEHDRALAQEKSAEERKYVLGAMAATALTVIGTGLYLAMRGSATAATAVVKKA